MSSFDSYLRFWFRDSQLGLYGDDDGDVVARQAHAGLPESAGGNLEHGGKFSHISRIDTKMIYSAKKRHLARNFNGTSPFQPVMVRNWELQIQFKVTGTTKDLFGDGIALWYTRDRMQNGPVFGSRDMFSGLAVIADTYSNHNGPHNVRNMFSWADRL
jgi:hypothetical protein